MKIYNSLSRQLEEFKPRIKGKATIYVCGITPYDTTHLGHAFTYISFDALIRFLLFSGYQVTYIQNVTDINDRDKDILEKAREQKISWRKLSKFWTGKFLENMKALNWTFPTQLENASESIPEMIDLIKKLLRRKLAYQINNSVYLNIQECPSFGKLSRFSRVQMIKTAKEFEEDIDNPEKKNPLDITLWRGTTHNQPKHIPSFPSPFGAGRPGWHIECSAISTSTLGDQIDIHGGGKDLIFPHHEAEIVQSEGATDKIPFVRYWIHTGAVFYQGAKMSKSKGNLVMVSDLLKKYSGNAIRWLLLSHHWSKPWEFKEEDLIIAQKNVEVIEKTILSYPDDSGTRQFSEILDQNLNTPKALELLLKFAREGTGLKNLYTILGFRKV